MKKNIMKTNIKQIKNLSARMPKTINEAINFNEDDDMDTMDYEPIEELPINNTPKYKDDSNLSAEELLGDIRKKTLRAMADLADTPEDPNYETLKKIFTMLDKAVVEKQEQREVLSKNNHNLKH